MSSKQRILRNPLLANTSKWLDDVPKKHHCKLIQDRAYNRKELNYNPYVQSLTKMDANSGTTVLPVGNSIRLTASVTTDRKTQVTLHPNLSNDKSTEPSRLISNYKSYIESLQGNSKIAQSYRPMQMDKSQLPRKFKVDFVGNISDEIENLYKERIQSLLHNVKTDKSGDGIRLIEMDGIQKWEDGVLKINKNLIGLANDTFISFQNNPELSRLIIAYCDFKS